MNAMMRKKWVTLGAVTLLLSVAGAINSEACKKHVKNAVVAYQDNGGFVPVWMDINHPDSIWNRNAP